MEQVVEVRPEIKDLFASVFKYDDDLNLTTSRKDVPKWELRSSTWPW